MLLIPIAPVVEARDAEPVALVRERLGAVYEESQETFALRLAREDNPGGSDDELVSAAARLMGFRRVGGDLQARFSAALK